MSSVIVLSSSPLRTFARSPTRIDLSSPHKPSQSSDKNVAKDENSYFAASDRSRDGFASSFTTAKEVLAARSTAENLPVNSRSSSKSALTSPRKLDVGENCRSETSGTAITISRAHAPVSTTSRSIGAEVYDKPMNRTMIQILPGDSNKKKRAAHTESLHLQRAAVRRKKWTPAKPHSQEPIVENTTSGFGLDLAASFGNSSVGDEPHQALERGEYVPTKRRKLDAAMSSGPKLNAQISGKGLSKTPTVRSKSPVKKSLTITGLATSHFAESSKEDITPMMHYLVSTQAMMETDIDPDTFETKVKKSSKIRKPKLKSRLRSPGTAIKSLDSQEVIFATASQLAREDSPTLLRDTVEAMKQSEEQYYSSPLRSQQTTAFSVQSVTPQKTGLARYRGRKSLWNAADRDEQDALLHADPEILHTGLKEAFAGKDALVETSPPAVDQEKKKDSMTLLATLQPEVSLFDIDDLPDSPPSPSHSDVPLQQRRQYSTSARTLTSKGTTEDSQATTLNDVSQIEKREISAPTEQAVHKLPPKPNYAAWGDDELKEACQIHGIKRLRIRKSMIDRLDTLWAERHGIDFKIVKAATKRASLTTKTLQPSDFLGNVHGLATRPLPKVKKPFQRKCSKKESQATTRQSSPAKSDGRDQISINDVIGLNDISGITAFDRIADIQVLPDEEDTDPVLTQLEPSTAPTRGTGVKASAPVRRGRKFKAKATAPSGKDRPLTPPPTMPGPTQFSSPGFEDTNARQKRQKAGIILSAQPTQAEAESIESESEDSLKGLIRKALTKNKDDKTPRNHYEQPTYYEKIQLYDPIILEEFTAWLNTEGFNAIGEDREIDVNKVRDWCHENGICCLWKGGWRANKKKGKIEE